MEYYVGRSIGSSAYNRRSGVDTCVGAVNATTANATAPARRRGRSRRGAPVIEHPPQDWVGQRDEPAKTGVARRRPTADDERPQDEEVDVGSSHECLPRPRGPDAVERLAAGEPILLLTDLGPEPLDAPHPHLRVLRAADSVDAGAAPKEGPDDGERREPRRPQAQRLDGDHERRLVSRARGGPRVRRGAARQERLDQIETNDPYR